MLAVTTLTEVKDAVLQLCAVAILALCGWMAKMIKDSSYRKKVLGFRIEDKSFSDMHIQEQLTSLRDRLQALRVYLSRFHNGDYYVDDSTIMKKTRTHESVRDGIAYQSEMMKGILLSSIPDEIKLVIEPGPSFKLVKDLQKGKLKWLCLSGGVKAIARCAVYKQGKIVGFVGVDFDIEATPDNIELVSECAGRIEQLL